MEAKIADGEVSMIAQARDQVVNFESTVLYMFVTLSDLAPRQRGHRKLRAPPAHPRYGLGEERCVQNSRYLQHSCEYWDHTSVRR